MRKRTFQLTESESNKLQSAYLHCQNADTKIRYQAVRLYGTGYTCAQIADICSCSRSSLMEWTRAYRQNGLPALVDHRIGGNRARLKPELIEAIQNQIHRYQPIQLLGKETCYGEGLFWTISDVATLLKRDYDVTFASPTSYRSLLAKCGFSFQRPAKQYKSHSDFKAMTFEELLEKNC